MDFENRILERFDELLSRVDLLVEDHAQWQKTASMGEYFDRGPMTGWFVSCEDVFVRVFGESSPFVRQLVAIRGRSGMWPPGVKEAAGVVRAAREVFADGYMLNLERLAAAEASFDLMQMSEHLLESDYHIAAATLAGAVLEHALRAVCDSHGVDRSSARGLSALNQLLRSEGVLDVRGLHEIQSWTDLRNKVDHHDFETPNQIDRGAVERMVGGVRDFINRHLR